MRLSTRLLGAAAAAALGGAGSAAHAAVVVNDDFEYADQAAFEAVWTPIGTTAPISAELSTAQSVSPTKSVRVPGTAAPTNGQHRNQRTFAETSTLSTGGNLGVGDRLIWSFDFFDSAPTAAPQRNHNNLQDSTNATGTNQLVSMGFNNNQNATANGGNRYMGRILGYNPATGDGEVGGAAGSYFKFNDFGDAGLRSAGWHNLKAVLTTDDGASVDYQFFVDNVLAEEVLNVGTAATIRSYDLIRIGSGLSNGSTEYFTDNMRLEFIPFPEPSSMALVGLGTLALARRRRVK